MQKTITHQGDFCVPSSIQIPGWGGTQTNNEFQPWHMKQFNSIANMGIDLIYPHDDVSFTNCCVTPFAHLSNKFYSLDLDFVLSTQSNHQLLVMPHYRYYTDDTWSAPLPVACAWETDWWPLPLKIIFRYTPLTKFIKNQPFAQAISIQTFETALVKMNEEETKRKNENRKYIEDRKNKYITRKWTMNSGIVQDNLYNVLSLLNKDNRLPFVTKNRKYRIVRSPNDLVQNK